MLSKIYDTIVQYTIMFLELKLNSINFGDKKNSEIKMPVSQNYGKENYSV